MLSAPYRSPTCSGFFSAQVREEATKSTTFPTFPWVAFLAFANLFARRAYLASMVERASFRRFLWVQSGKRGG